MMQENNFVKGMASRSFKIDKCFFGENCLPDLNDLFSESIRHPKAYGEFKRRMERYVINEIRRQLKGWKADKRIQLNIIWGEKNKGPLRDQDNVIGGGRKIINDALTRSGTIKDDNPHYIKHGKDEVDYTDKPYISVDIVEVEDFKM